jgi:GrpB-like predicted nucleotidyltransferase (UPF0157 family)
MIGLRKGFVELVPHRAEWRDLFETERQRLAVGLGHLAQDIQHVGSTAVPGLAAKPIIDIAVAVPVPADIARCRGPLCTLGYLDRGDQGADGGYVFVKESDPGVRTVHLHLVVIDDPQWENYLRFRDRLRADEALRTQYGELKTALQARFARDRERYTLAKHDFIRSALQEE